MHTAAAGPVAVRRLKQRSEFLRAARGQRVGRSAFSVQVVDRELAEAGIGFTVTKQQGNSPERNRIRRRLREAARICAADFLPQHDYVLVGRREALSLPFDRLTAELVSGLKKLHSRKPS